MKLEDLIHRYVPSHELPEDTALIDEPPQFQVTGYRCRVAGPEGFPFEYFRLVHTFDVPQFTIRVGLFMFHPASRPPFPYTGDSCWTMPTEGVKEFMSANSELPMVVFGDQEMPHMVLCGLLCDPKSEEPKFALTAEGYPILRLFTVAADKNGRMFHPDTHLKHGIQYEGVEIYSWGDVTFLLNVCDEVTDDSVTHASIYKAIYRRLRKIANSACLQTRLAVSTGQTSGSVLKR
ncbi:hypothetical protein J3E72DRAFT_380093 [Bipolaris maydis]|nr:hypothetical protein J3E74DRAFT_295889 [Bipolaris maydis]KAJ5052652.1 hypothetical protein J3E74DRAFT_412152 [Bipolaris maydis]KAJ6192321.1 hypothetical protein J3E72DRAFT_380093 [Bipolaris maydis]